MNRITLLITCFFLTLVGNVYCQEIGTYDKLSIERADKITNTCLKEDLSNKEYILFSNGDIAYLIIVKEKNFYKEYFVEIDTITQEKTQKVLLIENPQEILVKAFDTSIYHSGFINFESEFYKDGYTKAWGNNTYFVYVSANGERYGECRLSIIVEPNPIDKDVYNYLQTRITNYISGTTESRKKRKPRN